LKICWKNKALENPVVTGILPNLKITIALLQKRIESSNISKLEISTSQVSRKMLDYISLAFTVSPPRSWYCPEKRRRKKVWRQCC